MVADIPTKADRETPVRMEMVRLSAYVDLPLHELLARFERAGPDELLTSAITHAVDEGILAEIRAGAPVWESDVNVLVPVSWRMTGRHGRTAAGAGTISLLVVQSGRDAITELLADLPASAETHRAVVDVARQVLDEVTRRLESSGAG